MEKTPFGRLLTIDDLHKLMRLMRADNANFIEIVDPLGQFRLKVALRDQLPTAAPRRRVVPKTRFIHSTEVGRVRFTAKPGDFVKPGDIICHIEVAGMSNSVEIRCSIYGKIVKCLIKNGCAVQYGQKLVSIRPKRSFAKSQKT